MDSFTTNDLPVAAFLKASGHNTYQIFPENAGSAFFAFQFGGDPGELAAAAASFASGEAISALDFYQALQALRAEIRYARQARVV